jgi:hypothetical protein
MLIFLARRNMLKSKDKKHHMVKDLSVRISFALFGVQKIFYTIMLM